MATLLTCEEASSWVYAKEIHTSKALAFHLQVFRCARDATSVAKTLRGLFAHDFLSETIILKAQHLH